MKFYHQCIFGQCKLSLKFGSRPLLVLNVGIFEEFFSIAGHFSTIWPISLEKLIRSSLKFLPPLYVKTRKSLLNFGSHSPFGCRSASAKTCAVLVLMFTCIVQNKFCLHNVLSEFYGVCIYFSILLYFAAILYHF